MRTLPPWALSSRWCTRRAAGRHHTVMFNAMVAELHLCCSDLLPAPLTSSHVDPCFWGFQLSYFTARSVQKPADWPVLVCRHWCHVRDNVPGLVEQCWPCKASSFNSSVQQQTHPFLLFGITFIPLCILDLKTVGKWCITKKNQCMLVSMRCSLGS